MRRVLILRPEPGAGRTAQAAALIGLDIRMHPLFAAHPLDWSPPPFVNFDALLLTSANAARLAGPRLADYRALPAYTVGQASAAALQEQGFADVVTGTGDGTAIAATIAAHGHRAVLHLAGTMVAPMEAGPLTFTRIAVYTMASMPDDGALLRDAVPGSVLLVHSANAGQRLAERIPVPVRAALHVVAISPATMAACGTGWATLSAPALPRDDDMLALARHLCE